MACTDARCVHLMPYSSWLSLGRSALTMWRCHLEDASADCWLTQLDMCTSARRAATSLSTLWSTSSGRLEGPCTLQDHSGVSLHEPSTVLLLSNSQAVTPAKCDSYLPVSKCPLESDMLRYVEYHTNLTKLSWKSTMDALLDQGFTHTAFKNMDDSLKHADLLTTFSRPAIILTDCVWPALAGVLTPCRAEERTCSAP